MGREQFSPRLTACAPNSRPHHSSLSTLNRYQNNLVLSAFGFSSTLSSFISSLSSDRRGLDMPKCCAWRAEPRRSLSCLVYESTARSIERRIHCWCMQSLSPFVCRLTAARRTCSRHVPSLHTAAMVDQGEVLHLSTLFRCGNADSSTLRWDRCSDHLFRQDLLCGRP